MLHLCTRNRGGEVGNSGLFVGMRHVQGSVLSLGELLVIMNYLGPTPTTDTKYRTKVRKLADPPGQRGTGPLPAASQSTGHLESLSSSDDR